MNVHFKEVDKCECGGNISYQFRVIDGKTDKVCSRCFKVFGSLTNEELYNEHLRKNFNKDSKE